MRPILLTAMLSCLAAGCATERAYRGPAKPSSELALIEGAPRINAGLPLAPVIRKVDEQVVGLPYATVEVAPGLHYVLVDCVMAQTHTTTRYLLEIETYPGRRYVLVAESAPGNRHCDRVLVEER